MTEISGSVYPSEWIDMGFAITMPDTVAGTLGSDIEINPGNASFEWTQTSGQSSSFRWYVAGELKQSGSSPRYTQAFTRAGVYSVTCVAVDGSGLEMGHSTVTVTVRGHLHRGYGIMHCVL